MPLTPTARPPSTRPPQVAVVVASAGRPELLAELVDDLGRQTHRAFELVVSVPDESSLPSEPLPDRVRVVTARGASAQRNAAMRAAGGATHFFFFDDDSVVREDYIENALRHFQAHEGLVALTGRVVQDGAAAGVPEITRDEAVRAVDGSRGELQSRDLVDWRELHGCNFAFRADLAPDHFFDERLPLYSWLEDLDLAQRLLRVGGIAKVDDCVVVHRGVKSGGRVAHQRLGYSQVMNPLYLHRKGTLPLRRALAESVPRLGRNALGSLRRGESSWRRRRLLGNVRALGDVVRGRFTPERLVDIQPY